MTVATTRLRPLCLLLLIPLLLLAAPARSGSSSAPLPAPSEVIGGQTIGSATLACVGCIGGGIALSTMGVGWILAAASRPGSALAVAGCIWACNRALTY